MTNYSVAKSLPYGCLEHSLLALGYWHLPDVIRPILLIQNVVAIGTGTHRISIVSRFNR